MSKDSSSRKLLGTIKFVFDKTKSRTLNATQAYDTSTSQIVLASYPATSTINTSAKGPRGLGAVAPDYVSVGVTATTFASPQPDLTAREVKIDPQVVQKAITLVWTPSLAAKKRADVPVVTAQFSGAWWNGTIDGTIDTDIPAGPKSNATKETFAGNITVGTGLYRDWQNKYAVLKVDLLTNKAILRVYNE